MRGTKMGIKVGHGTKGVGGAAFVAGAGRRAERESDKAVDFYFKARQLNLQERSVTDSANLRQASINSANTRARERLEESRRRYEESPGRQLEMAVQQKELMKGFETWKYSVSQKREMEKINSSIDWIRQSNWTPEQKIDAEKQLNMRMRKVLPSRVFDDTPTVQQRYNQRIVTDPITGVRSYMDEKGKVSPLGDDISIKDYTEVWDSVVNAFSINLAEGEQPNQFAVEEEVGKRIDRYRRMKAAPSIAKARRQSEGPGPQQEQAQPSAESGGRQMTDFWIDSLAELEDRYVGRATKKAMEAVGQQYVQLAVEQGQSPKQAADAYMVLWKSERGRRGFWRDDVVPSTKGFDESKLLKGFEQPAKEEYKLTLKTLTESPQQAVDFVLENYGEEIAKEVGTVLANPRTTEANIKEMLKLLRGKKNEPTR